MTPRITFTIGAALVAAMLGLVNLDAQSPSATPGAAKTKIRIGVFDSRLVALAYYNSEEQRAARQRMTADLRDARAAGNEARVKELELQGPALQSLMHYQVFSTSSIPNVMEALGPSLSRLAEDAGVALIVSKWEISYHRDDIEYVDVTDALVRTFQPNAQVQKWIADAATQQPVPLLQLLKTMRADHSRH